MLNTTIMQDLNAINQRVRLTTQALKEERIRLIKQKVSPSTITPQLTARPHCSRTAKPYHQNPLY